MNYPVRPIYMREFVVVNFQTKFFDGDTRAWKAQAENVAMAESCSRQVWFGLQDAFADFPGRGRNVVNYFEDRDAYDFMLRLYLGLESKYMCEDSIKGQICDGWDAFQPTDARTKKVIDSIMQDMKADSRFVSSAILSSYKHYKQELAARDLSGQEKGDKALLIGSLNRHGKLSDFTDGLARVIGNKRAGRVDEIVVTNPDANVARVVYDHLRQLKTRGILAADIRRAGFGDLSKEIEKAERVYVDVPMGSNPDAEETIALTWATRVWRENTLTHMRGDPKNMGQSTEIWQGDYLDNYTSPEDIRADMAERGRHNSEVIQKALAAIKYCAKLRMEGDTPSNAKVKAFVEGLDLPAPGAPALKVA